MKEIGLSVRPDPAPAQTVTNQIGHPPHHGARLTILVYTDMLHASPRG